MDNIHPKSFSVKGEDASATTRQKSQKHSTNTANELQETLARLAKKSEDGKKRKLDLTNPEDKKIAEREDFLDKKRKSKEEQKESLEKSLRESTPLKTYCDFSLKELIKMEISEPRLAVPNLLQEGLTLLAGKPKKGKSWMALTLAMCVAHGRSVFGRFACPPGDVLYMPIEDRGNHYRLQRRCKLLLPKLLIDEDQIGNLQFELDIANSSKFVDVASDWVSSTKNPKLIIVDTLARIMPAGEYDNNDYKQAYRFMAGLQSWAINNHIAVIVIHHTNKGKKVDPIDEVMGSAGLTAVADSIWVYTRIKGKNVLYMTSRDLDSEKYFVIDYEKTGILQIEGELQDEISPERKQILKALGGRALSPKDLSEITGIESGNIRKLLWSMVHEESPKIQRNEDGQYSAV